MDLMQIVLSEEIPTFFERDETLGEREQLEQAKGLVAFMTSPIPREHMSQGVLEAATVNGVEIRPMQGDYFKRVLMCTYDKETMVDILFTDILQSLSKGVKRRFLNTRKKIRDEKYTVATTLTALIYLPDSFYPPLSKYMSEDVRNSISSSPESDNLAINPVIQEMQAKLIFRIARDNKKYINIARNLSYETITSDVFLNYDYFFREEDGYTKVTSNHTLSRLMFSFLSCHIGYFNRPQFGKWEAIYGLMSGRSLPELDSMDFNLFERTDNETSMDLRQQLKAQSMIFNYLSNRYHDLSEELSLKDNELTEKGGVVSKMENLLKRSEKTNSDLRQNLKQEKVGYNQRIETLKAKLQSEFNDKSSELRKKVKGDSKVKNERDNLRDTVEELRTQVGTYDEGNVSYENEIGRLNDMVSYWEKRWAANHQEPAYEVSVNVSDTRRKRFTPKHDSTINLAIERLSMDITEGEVLRKTTGGWAHRRLSSTYPEHDTFFKLKMPKHFRAIYVLGSQNEVTVLDVMTHEEYNRLCKPHK